MSLSEHRQAIDHLDAQIVRLLNQRTRHVLASVDGSTKTHGIGFSTNMPARPGFQNSIRGVGVVRVFRG
jgi:hypothetical protein